MHAQTITQERTAPDSCAHVGAWQFRKLCLSLSDTVRIKSGTRINFSCDDVILGHAIDVAQYLSRTNASFLVGDALNSLTGCNTLVSLHLQPGPHYTQDELKSFTYVSHSIKEFFDNIRKVPEKFIDSSAFHLCMDPQVQWVRLGEHFPTVHDHPDLFKPEHGSGPDALAKEIIANVTHSYVNDVYLFVGEPISAGYEQCDTARLDWEQDTNA